MQDQEIPVTKKKSPVPSLILALAALVLGAVLTLWAFWFFTRVEVLRLIPESTETYIEISSLAELFEKARDSTSLQKMVGALGGASAYTSLAEVQSMLQGSWSWARGLADMGAVICFDDKDRPLILLDSGWRGLVLQLLPLAQGIFTPPDIAISRTSIAGRTVIGFSEPGKESAAWYVVYEGSILAISSSLEQIRAALARRDAPRGEDTGFRAAFADLGPINDIRVRVQARRYLEALARAPDMTGRIIKALPALDSGVLGLEIQGDSLSTRAIFPAGKGQGGLERVFEPNQAFTIFDTLPESTSMASAIRVSSVEDLYAFAKEIMPGDMADLSGLDAILKPLLGLDHRELLFSWPGQEIALVNLADASSPVLVISIGSTDAFAKVQKALGNSLVLDVESNRVLDGIRLSRLQVPDLWKGLLGAFGLEFELPWYVLDQDRLVLSEDPELLARWMLERQQGKLLAKSAVFRGLAGQDGLRADLALFYDATVYRPAFLRSLPVFSGIAGSWRYGLASLARDPQSVRLELTLSGSLEPSLTLLPGFPKNLGIPLADGGYQGLAELEIRNVLGASNPELIYRGSENRMVLADLTGSALHTFPVSGAARLLYYPGDKAFGILEANGNLVFHRDAEGESWTQSEVLESGISPGAAALFSRGRWLLYQDSTGSIVGLDATGTMDTLSPPLPGPVFQAMAPLGQKLLVYPRNLSGQVQLLDPANPSSEDLPTWEAGSVLATGPVSASVAGHFLLVSEGGQASAWSVDQSEALGRSNLDGPVRTQPLAWGQYYAVLTEKGTLYLLDKTAKVVAERNLPELRGDSQWLSVNQDPPLLCAGRANTFWGFKGKLELLKGFPRPGTRAWFHNINGQGGVEIITVGYDQKVYAYELPD